MAESWRLVDTGLASAARNIALNRALLEARQAAEIPSTLRFLRFTPSVLLGRDQSAAQVLNVERCDSQHVSVQRRITGGRAFYVDEKHLGWELYLHRSDAGPGGLDSLSKRVCHAAAAAVSALGVDARLRGKSEIEVDGRAIGCGAIAVESHALLFQGVLSLEVSAQRLADVLRTPAEQLGDAPAAMRERYAGLAQLLRRTPEARIVKHNLTEAFESEFDVEFRDGDLSLSEERRLRAALRETETRGWIDLVARPASELPILAATFVCTGGTLRAALCYDCARETISEAWFGEAAHSGARRALRELEAELRDVPVRRLADVTEAFFAKHTADLEPLKAADVVHVVRLAIQQSLLARNP